MEEMTKLIDEAILLERNVGKLYQFFAGIFPKDNEFWTGLMHEENKHATLLSTVKELSRDKMILEAIKQSGFLGEYEKLRNANQQLESMIIDYESNTPTRDSAVYTALHIEQSGLEMAYEKLLKGTYDKRSVIGKIVKVLKVLDGDNKDHYTKVAEYFDIKPTGQKPRKTEKEVYSTL